MTNSWPAKNKRYQASRRAQENDNLLSRLPEEIMLSITSSFTMKDAARLGLVSRQCEFIWRCFPLLIFEDSHAMEKIRKDWNANVEERSAFVKRVDRVLERHLGKTIDELRITFDLDLNWQSHVDKWTAFALDKQVKRLELNFHSERRKIIQVRNSVAVGMCGECLDLPSAFTRINSCLTSLRLKYVNVTDEFIDYLSLLCPVLENLCIEGSKCLTRVSGSLQVKHLEVSHCENLKTIDISARKLYSFIHINKKHIELLHIADACSLSDISIGSRWTGNRVAYTLNSLSEHFSQLVHLSLTMEIYNEINLMIDNPVAMPNLEHLGLQVSATTDQSLRGWFPLIAASPNLQKLSLKLWNVRDPNRWSSISNHDTDCDCPTCQLVVFQFPLECLKTFEVVGYVGQPIDLELALFVLENALLLEEVIVEFVEPFVQNDVRERLAKLLVKIPQGVKLTVK